MPKQAPAWIEDPPIRFSSEYLRQVRPHPDVPLRIHRKTTEGWQSPIVRHLFVPLSDPPESPRLGVLVANKGKYGSWELFSEKTYESIMPVSLQEYIPNLDQKIVRGIGFTTMAPGFYGHSGGCGTCLLVDPENHIVFAMTRMQGDDEFTRFQKEAYILLPQLR